MGGAGQVELSRCAGESSLPPWGKLGLGKGCVQGLEGGEERSQRTSPPESHSLELEAPQNVGESPCVMVHFHMHTYAHTHTHHQLTSTPHIQAQHSHTYRKHVPPDTCTKQTHKMCWGRMDNVGKLLETERWQQKREGIWSAGVDMAVRREVGEEEKEEAMPCLWSWSALKSTWAKAPCQGEAQS